MQKILTEIVRGIKGVRREIGIKKIQSVRRTKGKLKKDNWSLVSFSKTWLEKLQSLSSKKRKLLMGGTGVALVLGVVFALNVSNIRGASFGWLQTDWSGGADTNAVATHASNQSGWTKFFSKDANVDTTGGEVKMSATSTSFVTTTDADFNSGTGVMTYVSGDAVMARKPNGGACTSNAMCLNDVCQNSVCAGPWIVGSCAGIAVYKQDVAGTPRWKTTDTACVGPQCTTGLDASYPTNYALVADNTVDFTAYPARNACKTLGGRLPTTAELSCIYTNRAQYNLYGAFQSSLYYWSATEVSATYAWHMYFPTGAFYTNGTSKSGTAYARCVQGI